MEPFSGMTFPISPRRDYRLLHNNFYNKVLQPRYLSEKLDRRTGTSTEADVKENQGDTGRRRANSEPCGQQQDVIAIREADGPRLWKRRPLSHPPVETMTMPR